MKFNIKFLFPSVLISLLLLIVCGDDYTTAAEGL